jgi:hypothetical protein
MRGALPELYEPARDVGLVDESTRPCGVSTSVPDRPSGQRLVPRRDDHAVRDGSSFATSRASRSGGTSASFPGGHPPSEPR